MRYGLLGPLEVVGDDGKSVALSGDRERVLVAVLLLGANRVVPTSRLTDALWGDQPPSTAGNALQVHVSRLRKKLAAGSAGGDLLRRESSGYRLTVAPGELDVQRFENLVGEDGGGPDEVSSRLHEALDLWRGPALADVSSDLLVGEAARLEELRLAVIERRIEADLARGCHAELVPELESLVHDHPLREGLRGQLMRALYRSGRQADAAGGLPVTAGPRWPTSSVSIPVPPFKASSWPSCNSPRTSTRPTRQCPARGEPSARPPGTAPGVGAGPPGKETPPYWSALSVSRSARRVDYRRCHRRPVGKRPAYPGCPELAGSR